MSTPTETYTCPACAGTGEQGWATCKECDGLGALRSTGPAPLPETPAPALLTSLRERALAELEEGRLQSREREWDEQEKRDRESREVAARLLEERFGVAVDEDRERTVIADGLEFSGIPGRWASGYMNAAELHLVADCPRCGERTASADVYSLSRLGELLESFYGGEWHRCMGRHSAAPAPPPEPTLAEQLEALVREIVRNELGNREEG